jgi:hypothetical protein
MNNIQSSNRLYGVTEGVYYGQNERVDEINSRINSRQFADSPLEPYFDPRPVTTKYSHFPIINRRSTMNEPAIKYNDYHMNINFNPGTSKSPFSGFINNIDKETILRNQNFAIQRGAEQGIYVPSSNSDLYKTSIISRPSVQPYPNLFNKFEFEKSHHPNIVQNIGSDTFFNHTRTQLRNM